MVLSNSLGTILNRIFRNSIQIGGSKGIHLSAPVCHRLDHRSAEERREFANRYKYIPSKYRVAVSASQKGVLDKSLLENTDAQYSDGSREHPLPDNPMVDYPYPIPDGGLQYYGFQYYPPHTGEIEHIPQEEVSPLFMVKRVKHLKGQPWYYKYILDKLGLAKHEEISKCIIVKNIPEMNEILYVVKHFIEIIPIKLPADLPLDADPKDCFLTEEGVFTYEPDRSIPVDELEIPEERENKRLDEQTIKNDCRKKFDYAWDLVP